MITFYPLRQKYILAKLLSMRCSRDFFTNLKQQKRKQLFQTFHKFQQIKKKCHRTAAGTQLELVRLSVECASPCGRPSFLATIWPENDQIHGFGQRKQNKQSEAKIGHMTIDLCPGRQLHKNREQTDSFIF